MPQKFTKEKFIQKSNNVHSNKYDYSLFEYINCKTKGLIKCKNCNNIFEQTADNHLRNHGCPNCKAKKLREFFTKQFEIFKKECNKIHNNEYEYFSKTYKNSNSKIKIKHKTCQRIFLQRASSHLNQNCGCPYCHKNNYSFGEISIENWLIQNNINFISQKTFNGCRGKKRPLPFDFFLPNKNICIEFDGKHHFGIGRFAKKSVNINDKIKDEYCYYNSIHLLRIPYWDRQNISQILKRLVYD